jgi:hypothetical protein
MKNSFKKSLMFLMLLLALTFSALGVTPALADDGVTPPADAPAVEQPVGDAPVVDVPATEQPVVADAPAVEEPVADAPIVEQPAADEPAAVASEILEAAPEGTEVVVLDESGEALPLASAEAAEVLASGDPYFWDGTQYVGYTTTTCPAIVKVCNVVSAPIQAAVDAFAASSSASGEIFIEAGTYDEKVEINGYTGNLANLSGLIGAGSGSTTINGFLNAYGFINPFTLSGINFNNWVTIESDSDVIVDDVVVDGSTSETGMWIYSGGNVELNKVVSTENAGLGLVAEANGDVSVWDSSFNNNGYSGLAASSSDGNVILDGVTASGNKTGDGADVSANGDISIWDSSFNENGYTGLYMYSDSGNVLLDGVTANGNLHGNGADVNANGGDISIFDSSFNENAYNGLYTYSNGNVMLDGVNTSGNVYRSGAIINAYSDISIFDSTFNENARYGLYAQSYGGNVMLDGVTANGNGTYGVSLSLGSSEKLLVSAPSTSMVEVFCSNFSDNAFGLYANSPDLYLNGVTFSGNTKVDYKNGNPSGNVWVNEYECGKTPSTESHEGPEKKEQSSAPLYITIEQTQAQLPGTLGDGFKFGSALKVELTNEGKDVNDLAMTLSFPIPADMKDAKLAVMFWNGSAWVEVPGGSVVNGFFVITVDQPGNYVLVAK